MAYTTTTGTLAPYGWQTVTLTGPNQSATILSGRGFNLYEWTYEGGEMLMQPADFEAPGAKYGIPLLFPTPNRMQDATYTFRGQTRVQRKRGQAIQRHGLVLDEPWQVRCWAEADAAFAQGTLVIDEQSPLYEAYPFPMEVTCTYRLGAEGLRLEFAVVNTGGEDAPFGFAIHPYFSKRGDPSRAWITHPLTRIYENDPELLPSGRILPVAGTELDISDGFHSVQSLGLDHVYRGMTEDQCAQVLYGDGTLLTLRGADVFRNLIVFTPKDRAGFCLEHQTCSTNMFALYGRGLLDESGLLILPPGQRFSCWIDLSVQRLAELPQGLL